jgi:2-methylcitrate dehydratase PrpD
MRRHALPASDPKDPAPAAVAAAFSAWAAGLSAEALPARLREVFEFVLLDAIGLCVAARNTDYLRATLAACDSDGACTAIGQARGLDPAGAALVNGTAIHGEDYDDTFEGTPVHCGAAIAPAVLAACEGYGLGGGDALRGMAVGTELMCRLALVAPTAVHRAGFHPTGVIGALGAAAGVAAALDLDAARMTSAIGIAGSFASGIIEYLAEGTWTKRLHPGWAAQAGLRAARLAQEGFLGPRTVIEGTHGFFKGFAAEGIARDYGQVTERLGESWQAEHLAFKPYACGTMLGPFIDCALSLRRDGLDPVAVESIACKVGEGTVHRLWEPRAEKTAPSTAYSAKFSGPYAIAVALTDGAAGLDQFTEARAADPILRALAARIEHRIDPDNEYPRNYSGHLRVRLRDGGILEAAQPHLRGGRHAPLGRDQLIEKMRANLAHGGWPAARARQVDELCRGLFDAPDLGALAALRN